MRIGEDIIGRWGGGGVESAFLRYSIYRNLIKFIIRHNFWMIGKEGEREGVLYSKYRD